MLTSEAREVTKKRGGAAAGGSPKPPKGASGTGGTRGSSVPRTTRARLLPRDLIDLLMICSRGAPSSATQTWSARHGVGTTMKSFTPPVALAEERRRAKRREVFTSFWIASFWALDMSAGTSILWMAGRGQLRSVTGASRAFIFLIERALRSTDGGLAAEEYARRARMHSIARKIAEYAFAAQSSR